MTPEQRANAILVISRAVERAISESGGLREAAKRLGVAPATLCNVRKGKYEPSPKMADALGIEKIVEWRKKK